MTGAAAHTHKTDVLLLHLCLHPAFVTSTGVYVLMEWPSTCSDKTVFYFIPEI